MNEEGLEQTGADSPDFDRDEAGSPGAAAQDAGSYESAISRLDEIIGRLDSGDAQLRETLDLCAEAKGLIEYCAGELAAVDQGLKELRLEDLANSLSATPEPGPEPGSDPA